MQVMLTVIGNFEFGLPWCHHICKYSGIQTCGTICYRSCNLSAVILIACLCMCVPHFDGLFEKLSTSSLQVRKFGAGKLT